jgi:hypothetical protein
VTKGVELGDSRRPLWLGHRPAMIILRR